MILMALLVLLSCSGAIYVFHRKDWNVSFGSVAATGAAMGISFALLAAAGLSGNSAFGGILRYTQTCSNGDQFLVNRVFKKVSITHGSITWDGKYDDAGSVAWSTDNPPVPTGKTLPQKVYTIEDGAVFDQGDIDDLTFCSVNR
jgi:hypothetical protein